MSNNPGICQFCFEKSGNCIDMIECIHTFCLECASEYFLHNIVTENIHNLNCITCNLPSIENMEQSEHLDYFKMLLTAFKPFENSAVVNGFLDLIHGIELNSVTVGLPSLMTPANNSQQEDDTISAVSTAEEASNDGKELDILEWNIYQTCDICTNEYTANEMVSMIECTHYLCNGCFKQYFTDQIQNKTVYDIICPFCNLPNLKAIDPDGFTQYFSLLDILLKTHLDKNVHELFQNKSRDHTLIGLNWRWCTKCPNGYFIEPNHAPIQCSGCAYTICGKCEKPWESQHLNISCEQFNEWKLSNDSGKQTEGIALYLRNNSITCPNCKMRFYLARGGCMHYTCTQCAFEFCYGCQRQFKCDCDKNWCTVKGRHAHHPRNCLFYLRDFDVNQIESLLERSKISFEINSNVNNNTLKCSVRIQSEQSQSTQQTCGLTAGPEHFGLCRIHYVEHLVYLIMVNKIDPIDIMNLQNCELEIIRNNFKLPSNCGGSSKLEYHKRLQQFIQTSIPITNSTCIEPFHSD